MQGRVRLSSCVFFNDTATTEIYTLSLHDALPISPLRGARAVRTRRGGGELIGRRATRQRKPGGRDRRSEEHTSELQSRQYLVCRLLLEKKTHTIAHPRPARDAQHMSSRSCGSASC